MNLKEIKDSPMVLAVLFAISAVFCYLMLEWGIERVLALFGGGGLGAAELQRRSRKNKTIADEHMELSKGDSYKAVNKMKEADKIHTGTQKIADSIHRDQDLTSEKKRKIFRAS
jgi:hypothetical protein